ncbi:MAG: phosphopantetheine-binding protein [Opitutales bacterium]
MNQDLAKKIKALMKKTLNLEEEQLQEIHEETALMENGLELDSIDALELVVGVEKEFGIKIQSSEEATKAFSSFGAFVDYVETAMSDESDSAEAPRHL